MWEFFILVFLIAIIVELFAIAWILWTNLDKLHDISLCCDKIAYTQEIQLKLSAIMAIAKTILEAIRHTNNPQEQQEKIIELIEQLIQKGPTITKDEYTKLIDTTKTQVQQEKEPS